MIVFPKFNFYTKLLNLNLCSSTVNIQISKQKMTDNKVPYKKNINTILKQCKQNTREFIWK